MGLEGIQSKQILQVLFSGCEGTPILSLALEEQGNTKNQDVWMVPPL